MEQPPPLSPEEVAHLSAKDYAHLGQPQTVKVFGIIHLIFGGYGVLMLLWTLVIIFYGNPLLALTGNTPEMQAQENLQKEMMGYTIVSTAVFALLTVIIIMAGMFLLKGRKRALKYSNWYAWLSIASKIMNVIVSFVYLLPMTREMITTSSSSAGLPASSMEIVMTSSLVGTFILGIIYPILSLILLNRPNVKTWFDNQPA
jgi:hypothetical protein